VTGYKFSEVSFSFSISKTDLSSPDVFTTLNNLRANEIPSINRLSTPSTIARSPYVTTPPDFPKIHVTTPANGVDDGYIFASNFIPSSFLGNPNPGSYLLILDNNGEPVYYQKVPETALATDFKKLSNGLLAYWEGDAYHLLNSSYTEVGKITSGNGYPGVDLHDLKLLPDGHYLFLIYYIQKVDMSKLVPGGNPNATVTGVVIQELDTKGNVVFLWNSFDHIPVTDSNRDLTAATIDYTHSNAIDLDSDGNILLSSRHLDEITKINRQTGEIIWRLGGKGNQFTIIPAAGITDIPEFYMQHDIRKLPNGNIGLFDNHNDHTPMNSRAMEFSLNQDNKTATLVWEYRNSPDVYSAFMGDVQHLPNGNILIGWGGVPNPNITEIKPDNTKIFELGFDAPYVNYRAYRFPWHGNPNWAPNLVMQPGADTIRLTFSWNGATDVARYDVYGGKSAQTMTPVARVEKTGFETSISLVGIQTNYCYYKVLPILMDGQSKQPSNIVRNPACRIPTYFPFIFNSRQ
ncbi:MAG: aryl-sulfate sulfotransferase, partial [Omnitrophica WOR_2 bacterium]